MVWRIHSIGRGFRSYILRGAILLRSEVGSVVALRI